MKKIIIAFFSIISLLSYSENYVGLKGTVGSTFNNKNATLKFGGGGDYSYKITHMNDFIDFYVRTGANITFNLRKADVTTDQVTNMKEFLGDIEISPYVVPEFRFDFDKADLRQGFKFGIGDTVRFHNVSKIDEVTKKEKKVNKIYNVPHLYLSSVTSIDIKKITFGAELGLRVDFDPQIHKNIVKSEGILAFNVGYLFK